MKMRLKTLLCAMLLVCTTTACANSHRFDANTVAPETTTSTTVSTHTTTTSNNGEDHDDTPPGSTPLFYKVTDRDGDFVWLLGSIHVATQDMYPLPKSITKAYSAADSLAVECDVIALESDYDAMGKIMASWLYEKSGHIYDHIDAELYEEAKLLMDVIGLYTPLHDRYVPAVWSSFIDNYLVSYLGYDSEIGIDAYFLNRAKEENKPILEIESVTFQNQMMIDFSEELQEFLLKSSVEAYYDPETPDRYTEMIDVWCAGDEERFEAFLASEDDDIESDEERTLYEEYNNAMLVERNRTMTDFAEDCLKKGEEVFICVGAAHVVGEGAIVDVLRERGYTVELEK